MNRVTMIVFVLLRLLTELLKGQGAVIARLRPQPVFQNPVERFRGQL
jgi:hypothetical protein